MTRKTSTSKASTKKIRITIVFGSLFGIIVTIIYAFLNQMFPEIIYVGGFIPFDVDFFFTFMAGLVVPLLIVIIFNELRKNNA